MLPDGYSFVGKMRYSETALVLEEQGIGLCRTGYSSMRKNSMPGSFAGRATAAVHHPETKISPALELK
ncbi:hypothetical protein GUJ93_ZPchr0010g8318 [Zizania palustris]|uniref:Uncharacterized protein n=1 Tax=Zizania palustris TaxID=103762 RepID=A0A8J5SZC0_ZIZPA|nr:hypothetical protein GUJ93_ZPchr0010g8318 [Zizania palustris]